MRSAVAPSTNFLKEDIVKRHFLWIGLSALLVIAHGSSYGQTPIRIGIEGGLNLANQSISGNYSGPSRENRAGIVIGGVAELGISDLFFIQIEPRYTQKGMKWGSFERRDEANQYLGTFESMQELDYLELPLLLKMRFGSGGFRPYAFIGPNIGILLSAKYRLTMLSGGPAGTPDETQDVKSKVASTDACFDFGAGAEYLISPNIALFGAARYSLGLNNISREAMSSNKTTSTGIQFLVGILFGL
jgi:hypothetical protein